eukprot:2810242-Pyramimonas_sp.AAC.3
MRASAPETTRPAHRASERLGAPRAPERGATRLAVSSEGRSFAPIARRSRSLPSQRAGGAPAARQRGGRGQGRARRSARAGPLSLFQEGGRATRLPGGMRRDGSGCPRRASTHRFGRGSSWVVARSPS